MIAQTLELKRKPIDVWVYLLIFLACLYVLSVVFTYFRPTDLHSYGWRDFMRAALGYSMAVAGLGICVFQLIKALTFRAVMTNEGILLSSSFSREHIPFSKIRTYRLRKGTGIPPIDAVMFFDAEGKPCLTIHLHQFENGERLLQWLRESPVPNATENSLTSAQGAELSRLFINTSGIQGTYTYPNLFFEFLILCGFIGTLFFFFYEGQPIYIPHINFFHPTTWVGLGVAGVFVLLLIFLLVPSLIYRLECRDSELIETSLLYRRRQLGWTTIQVDLRNVRYYSIVPSGLTEEILLHGREGEILLTISSGLRDYRRIKQWIEAAYASSIESMIWDD